MIFSFYNLTQLYCSQNSKACTKQQLLTAKEKKISFAMLLPRFMKSEKSDTNEEFGYKKVSNLKRIESCWLLLFFIIVGQTGRKQRDYQERCSDENASGYSSNSAFVDQSAGTTTTSTMWSHSSRLFLRRKGI